MNVDNTVVLAEFVVSGEKLNPDLLTIALNITPTKTWSKGDIIKGTKDKKRQFNRWQISTSYEPTFDINDQLIKLYEILKGQVTILNNLRVQYELEYEICVTIKIFDDKKPAIYFDHWLIDFAHEIGAIIAMDLYY
jgi:hypothetical protein